MGKGRLNGREAQTGARGREREKQRLKLNMKDLGQERRPRPLRVSDLKKEAEDKNLEDEKRRQALASLSPESAQCQQLVFKTAGGISSQAGSPAVPVNMKLLHHPNPDLFLPPKCC